MNRPHQPSFYSLLHKCAQCSEHWAHCKDDIYPPSHYKLCTNSNPLPLTLAPSTSIQHTCKKTQCHKITHNATTPLAPSPGFITQRTPLIISKAAAQHITPDHGLCSARQESWMGRLDPLLSVFGMKQMPTPGGGLENGKCGLNCNFAVSWKLGNNWRNILGSHEMIMWGGDNCMIWKRKDIQPKGN